MKQRFTKAILFFIVVIGIGFIGYSLFFGFSLVDALYMSVITITTVGFTEVEPLNDASKIFTIVLILLSVSSYGYLVSMLSEYLSNMKLMEANFSNKTKKKINQLSGHTIVCGYGRNGQQAHQKLSSHKTPCVVVEQSFETVQVLNEKDIMFVQGDATNDEVLVTAGIEKAQNLITTFPSDADNLYVVLSARQLNPTINIVSRASVESSQKKLKIAGANHVIMPDKIGGDHMASLLVAPDLVEFVNNLTLNEDISANLKEIEVDDLPKSYLQRSIQDLDLRKKTGCNVIGYITESNEYIINPPASTTLKSKARIIVLGDVQQVNRLNNLF